MVFSFFAAQKTRNLYRSANRGRRGGIVMPIYAQMSLPDTSVSDTQVTNARVRSTIPSYEAAISQLRGLSWRDSTDENTSGSSIMELDELNHQREFIDIGSRINDPSPTLLASPLPQWDSEERRAQQTWGRVASELLYQEITQDLEAQSWPRTTVDRTELTTWQNPQDEDSRVTTSQPRASSESLNSID